MVRLARLIRFFGRPKWITTRLTRLHAAILRASKGHIRRSWAFALGQHVMPITTIGRRSGKQRSTVVAYFHDGESLVTTASNLGNTRDPAWALNLEANPEVSVVVGGERRSMRARRARGAERERLWRRWEELQPPAKSVAAIARREIPVFVLEARSENGGSRAPHGPSASPFPDSSG
jgi:deazaflavin-dependent oxidoreductase (nitroreductase family)